ncbi:protein pelota [Podospora fimiseda]|uniref:Protein DOM34 homolog n=1 Tax=Podospora fimiseda TaxID=252190 RepID=A0AAN7BJN9_9PEZI|nr:protein pelota [Podospora fimiseda]
MRFTSLKQSFANLNAEDPVGLMITDSEDMWHCHNLVQVGDVVKAPTVRKTQIVSDTGTVSSKFYHINLAIKVISTFFDPLVSELRIAGQVLNENDYVAVGQHHTITLKYGKDNTQPTFMLHKPQGWDSVAVQMLREALSDEKPDAMVAVVMQEGLANICLITKARTLIKQRIESSVSKKRSTSKEIDSGLKSFFDKTLTALLTAIDWSSPRTLLLASPGFVAQNFRSFIKDRADRTADKSLQKLAKDAVVVHTSTGHVHSLNEVLKSPEVQKTMSNTKYTSETAMMDRFYEKFRRDDGRAWYGVKPVTKAILEGAVGRGGGVLFVNNSLFRSMDIAERKKYVALVDKVKEDGGEALVLSSDHESGQRLDALGGIAAILTYPLHDLDEDEEEENANDGSAEGTTVI